MTCAKALAVAMISAMLPSAGIANERPPVGDPVPRVASTDGVNSEIPISELVPLVVTTHQRRRLATEVKDSLRRGDLESAERRLDGAIEEGTLALLLRSELRNPELLASLEILQVDEDDKVIAASVAPHATPSPYNPVKLREALERESADKASVERKLADVLQEYSAYRASTEQRISQLEAGLHHEQQRVERTRRQVEIAQEELRAVQTRMAEDHASSTGIIADVKQALVHERSQSDTLALELAKIGQDQQTSQKHGVSGPGASMLRMARDGVQPPLPSPAKKWPDHVRITELTTGAIATQPEPKAHRRADPTEDSAASKPSRVAADEGAKRGPSGLITRRSKTAEFDVSAGSDEADSIVTARAKMLLRQGNVDAARRLLAEAVEEGSGSAARLLAQTFGQQNLSREPAPGVRGIASKAREPYAQTRGISLQMERARMEPQEWVTWQD